MKIENKTITEHFECFDGWHFIVYPKELLRKEIEKLNEESYNLVVKDESEL